MNHTRIQENVSFRSCAIIAMVAVLFGGLGTLAAQAKNPLPFVNQPLVPASIAPGGPGFLLLVTGTGFLPGAVVNWNGAPRPTVFVRSGQLKATILATDIANPSTATIMVVNPAPGGGASNVVYFPIGRPAKLALTGAVYTSPASQDIYTSALVATGDVNNDGKVDVIENLYSNPTFPGGGVVTFLGNGDGTLQTSIVSTGPCQDGPITVGDFNNDGKLDVVASGLTQSGGAFCIMLGNGDGTFGPGQPLSLGPSGLLGTSPVVGDFNGDGNLDVAVGHDVGTKSISLSLGKGDGTMLPPVEIPTGFHFGNKNAIGVGDFNHDGKLDLAVGGDGIAILYGNGDGTFRNPLRISPSGNFTAIAVGDFNGDGNLDVVGSGDSTVLAVLLGNGDGTFRPEVDYPLFYGNNCTVVGDFNNDGTLDLGCNGSGVSAKISFEAAMFLGKGDGTFQPEFNFNGPPLPAFSAAGGDFNNDGHLDLALGQYGGLASVAVYLETTARLNPGLLNFAGQTVGTHQSLRSTLTNVGTSTLDIGGVTVTGLNATDFAVQTTCGTSLAAGASCILTVVFTPSEITVELATLNLADDAVGSPQTIPLMGTGSAFLMDPLALNFGNVPVGQSSAPQNVTVKNMSKLSVDVGTILISGSATYDFSESNNCPVFLRPGASCQIAVVFTPTATGIRTATLYTSQSTTTALRGNGT